MLKLVRYTIIWVSQNLSIPFWMVGHVHLSVNVYDDIYEILASMWMNILVAVGFVLSYIDEQKK